jgi:hypothetical protein
MWIFLELNQRLWAKDSAIIRTTSLEKTKSVDQHPSSEIVCIYSTNLSAFLQPEVSYKEKNIYLFVPHVIRRVISQV